MERLSAKEAVKVLLNPKSIVYVGASANPEKPSGQGIRNIYRAGYEGKVFAVNVRGAEIEGHSTYTSTAEIGEEAEVAFITVKSTLTPQAIRDLAATNTKVAIVAVGGFAEMGNQDGQDLQEELARAAEETGVRLVGPVCNGVYSAYNKCPIGYNATHARTIRRGPISLVSHSGALLGPMVAAVENSGSGLARFVSCGSEADLCMADYVEYMVDDDETKVIALIVDSVGDGKRFRQAMSKARKAGKPVVALKLGDSALGKEATKAHSSHLAGSKEAYDAILKAEGVIRVPTLEALAITASLLAQGKRPQANTVTACSTSGGGAIMMADRFDEQGIKVGHFTSNTVDNVLQSIRFQSATIVNPFDLGLGGRYHYIENVKKIAADPCTGVLVCYATPMATEEKRVQMAHAFTDVTQDYPELPVLVLFPGKLEADEAAVYEAAGVPVVKSTLEMVAIVKALLSYYKDPILVDAPISLVSEENLSKIQTLPSGAQSEADSKEILKQFDVAMPREKKVSSCADAATFAAEIGYPVVLKATGKTILHKSEYGLVKVNIKNESELVETWNNMNGTLAQHPEMQAEGFLIGEMVHGETEVIFGVTKDAEFGHIAILGPGGIFAELLGAEAMARAPLPLNRAVIEEMINSTVLDKLLSGYRGKPAGDREALISQIEKMANCVYNIGDKISALDVNPILVADNGAWPLDALMIME